MKSFKDFNIQTKTKTFTGPQIEVDEIFNKVIIVQEYKILPSKYPEKYEYCLHLQLLFEGKQRVLFSGSKYLIEMIRQVPDGELPFETMIVKKEKRFEFK